MVYFCFFPIEYITFFLIQQVLISHQFYTHQCISFYQTYAQVKLTEFHIYTLSNGVIQVSFRITLKDKLI